MIPTLVIALAVGLVSADIGIGYQYKVPQTSYGSPVYQTAGSGANIQGLSSAQGQQGGFGLQNNGYQTGFQSAGASGLSEYQQGTGSQYQTSGLNSGASVLGLSSGGSNAGYQNSGYTGGSSNVGYQNTGFTGGSSGNSNTGYQNAGFTGGSSGSSNTGYQNAGFTSGSSGSSNTGYQNAGFNAGSVGSNSNYENGGYSGLTAGIQNTGSNSGSSSLGLNSGSSNFNVQPTYQTGGSANQVGYKAESHYQTSQAHKYQYNYVQQQQPAQVFKHFYVHAAPEETEIVRPRQPVVLPAPQKHYKIIFIKTPSQSLSSSQYFPVQQQNEEKTIVYVLVNKPEQEQDVAVPSIPPPKPPSKPEVYFIKYNTKEGSQGVINNIVNGYNKGSSSVSYTETDAASNGAISSAQTLSTDSSASSGQISAAGADSSISLSAATASHGNAVAGYEAASAQHGQFEQQSTGISSNSQIADGTLNTISQVSSVTESAASASTLGHEGLSVQGVPHQNYGPPNFRQL